MDDNERAEIVKGIKEGRIRVAPSAAAGLREIQTGDPGVPVIELTEHEVTDLVLSGVAFTVDGKYKLVDREGRLRRLREVWRASGELKDL